MSEVPSQEFQYVSSPQKEPHQSEFNLSGLTEKENEKQECLPIPSSKKQSSNKKQKDKSSCQRTTVFISLFLLAFILSVFLALFMLTELLKMNELGRHETKNTFSMEEQKLGMKGNFKNKMKYSGKNLNSNNNVMSSQENDSKKLIQEKQQIELKQINTQTEFSMLINSIKKYQQSQKAAKSYIKPKESHPVGTEHSHQPTPYNTSTMGVPEIGYLFNFTLVTQQSRHQYQEKMDNFFKPFNDTDCIFKRYGEENDGGYLMCQNYLANSEAIINLGVNGYDQFGCDVSGQFPQPNYQYDCTDNRQPICNKNNGSNIFELACTRQRTEFGGQIIYSLQDLLKKRSLIKKHIILKIDIEGGQWETFRSFPRQYLDYIDQIVIEIHIGSQFSQLYWGNLQIVKALEEKFVNVNLHMNNFGCLWDPSPKGKFPSHAFQATLVNKKLIKLNSPTRSYQLHSLNTKNNVYLKDCQMSD